MKRLDVAKILFVVVCGGTLIGLAFTLGMYSGLQRNAAYRVLDTVKKMTVDSFWLVWAEAETATGLEPSHHLGPSTYPGAGVTVNKGKADDLILLSGFFEQSNEVRLIRRDGEIVQRWPVSFYDLFPEPDHLPGPKVPATDWNIDLHGALAMPDGSVVFNFEYAGTVRLDRCGDVVWTLPRRTHHSVERAEKGGFWIPSRRSRDEEPTPFPPFPVPFDEDTILRVSDDGVVLEEMSVPGLFYNSGLEAILTATGKRFEPGYVTDELVHLNKVEELTSDIASDFEEFEAGDLALSIREYNLILVVDPDERRIKWWQTGPWVRQHDPEFKDGGTIVVFNNNLYRAAFGSASLEEVRRVPKVSNILEVDPASGRIEVTAGGEQNVPFSSVIRGKVEVLPDDHLLITEFQNGRVFEIDRDGSLVWEYINRYDEDRVAELSEARAYPAQYFTVEDWSCP